MTSMKRSESPEKLQLCRTRWQASSMIRRRYEPGDLAGIIEVCTASINVLAAPFYSREQISAWAPAKPDVERWKERLAQLQTIVAEADGFLAGFVSYTNEGYLDFLFTHPKVARRGVATAIGPKSCGFARKYGDKMIVRDEPLAVSLLLRAG